MIYGFQKPQMNEKNTTARKVDLAMEKIHKIAKGFIGR